MVSARGALGGAATGAAIGSVIPGVGTAIGAGVGGLAGLFMGGKQEGTELEDIRSPEQIAAARILQQLGQTGSAAGINLGQPYGGATGYYQQTPGELQAQNQLAGLFSGPQMNQASDVYSKLAQTQFNPDDPSSGFSAFSKALAKSSKEAEDVLNRESAITGSRFGTAIAGEKANLASDVANQKGMFLADLFKNQQQVALQGALGLQNITMQKAQLSSQLQQQSAIERQLKDQQARDQLNEFKRQRGEELKRIDILQTEANRNPYMGVSSIPGESPFSGLVNSVLSSLGQAGGKSLAESIFGMKNSGPNLDMGSNSDYLGNEDYYNY